MRSALRSINLAALLFALAFLVPALVVPTTAHAQTSTADPDCKMVNGVFTCPEVGTPGVSCATVKGVYTCGDGSLGGGSPVCITNSQTGDKTCLSGIGGVLTTSPLSTLGKGLGVVRGLPQQVTGTGWLSRITGWLSYAVNTVFTAVVQVLKDLVTYVLGVILSVVAMAIASIPVPSWISQYSMGSLLGQTGPLVGFFLSKFRIPEGLVLIGAGYAFRLTRKFLTLFQW